MLVCPPPKLIPFGCAFNPWNLGGWVALRVSESGESIPGMAAATAEKRSPAPLLRGYPCLIQLPPRGHTLPLSEVRRYVVLASTLLSI